MKRIALLRLDGIYEIRLCTEEPDKISLMLYWPDNVVGKFIGYTLNGFLKYKVVKHVLDQEQRS